MEGRQFWAVFAADTYENTITMDRYRLRDWRASAEGARLAWRDTLAELGRGEIAAATLMRFDVACGWVHLESRGAGEHDVDVSPSGCLGLFMVSAMRDALGVAASHFDWLRALRPRRERLDIPPTTPIQ